jgi:hypothetical protein
MPYDWGDDADCSGDSEGAHCSHWYDGDDNGGFDCCWCGED